MRVLFLLLVLANAGFFAWARLLGGDGEQRDPRPLQRQVAAEQIRILSARELGAMTPVKPESPKPAADAELRACIEWGSFTVTDAPRAEKALERSEERRVGKECTSWCRSRWSPYH